MGKNENIHFALRDVNSYGIFFTENYHIACLIASRYILDNQGAEDVVQDVFIKIWEKRTNILIHTNLKHYLLNSVKNASINSIQRKKELHVELLTANIQQSFEEGDDQYVSEELAVKIDKAIETLPPQCKRIFLLAFIDNLTYQEIADTLNLSKNTVKTQIGIAYKLLRGKLKDSFFNLFVLLFRRSKSVPN